ncbi:MAG TPA: GlmU family protein [Ignavibacteriaceae bacterium]|nr:GlmU family protein [Ignavibacteriaceae bacterium]
MQICIFEDANYINLEPLIYPRPVYELVCGITTLKEKILRNFPKYKYSLHCRPYLENTLQSEYPDIPVNKIPGKECLFINGRLMTNEKLNKVFDTRKKNDCVFMSGNTIMAAKVSGKRLEQIKENLPDVITDKVFAGLEIIDADLESVNYIWDLINWNGGEIKKDYKFLTAKKKSPAKKSKVKIHPGVNFVNKKNVFIGSGTEIKPGCVIDASNGPVYIDKNVLIYPNAVIEGPAYIGEGSKIKSGATIYENVSIGKICKVGGEVEDVIMLPYTNKQHAGFIGHAYLGSWANLGADTNNSDLKNNYGSVKVTVNGSEIDSGSQFLGLIMGDHSKSSINTMFNTGTSVGFSCNIFGAGFPANHIPSFSWGGSEELKTYKVEKSIETAAKVFKRRNKVMTEADDYLFRKIFELTEEERKKKGIL